jgi:hypothetical protein
MNNKILQNPMAVKHLAQRLRQKLSEGYAQESRFLKVLATLSDETLVEKYLCHEHHASQIVREFRKLLHAQTTSQKTELRKNIVETMERERRTAN